MSYLGNKPADSYLQLKTQQITGTGTDTYTLDYPVSSASDLRVIVNNVPQNVNSYTASNTTLTLGGTISASDECWVHFLGRSVGTQAPATGSVTGAMLSKPFNYDSGTLYLDDTNNKIGIGTTSPSSPLHVKTTGSSGTETEVLRLETTGTNDNSGITIDMRTSHINTQIAMVDGTGSYDGMIVFRTASGSALATPSERMRIDGSGVVYFGTTNGNPGDANVVGTAIRYDNGQKALSVTGDGNTPAVFNLKGTDGNVVNINQDGTTEGAISVSGTTVTYVGGHLGRWSQLTTNTRDENIVKGTVMSNLDDMCVWGDENNEQLNKMKVSDIEGDDNVAGVFVSWDDFDEVYTNDMNIAMTGDMVIRIAQGVTVTKGQLLMSAGDGTAKPQGDDIVRSKTIAKVTSNNVTKTYDDGSYLVPCVLMAC